ncbi:MAG: tetratricopeptide repeat protein [Nanoarchaeota archaeon]
MKAKARYFLSTVFLGAFLVASGCATSHLTFEHRVTPLSPRLSSTPYATIGHTLLTMEESLGTLPSDYQTLEHVLENVRALIPLKTLSTFREATNVLHSIDMLLKREGFSYKECNFLSTGLRTGQVDCDMYSFLYLSMGEKYGLPLRAVTFPQHMFIRWNSPSLKFNWETTNGTVETDAYYQQVMIPRIQKEFPAIKNWKMVEHTPEELASYAARYIADMAYHELGKEKARAGKSIITSAEYLKRTAPIYSAAAHYLGTFLTHNPFHVPTCIMRGDLFLKAERFDDAIRDYTQVLDLEPQNASVLLRRSEAYYQKANHTTPFSAALMFMQRGNEDHHRAQSLSKNSGSSATSNLK